jgi:hypothetical protein
VDQELFDRQAAAPAVALDPELEKWTGQHQTDCAGIELPY